MLNKSISYFNTAFNSSEKYVPVQVLNRNMVLSSHLHGNTGILISPVSPKGLYLVGVILNSFKIVPLLICKSHYNQKHLSYLNALPSFFN